ncbi:MAG: VOC family protein [Bacteroidia bacterium]|nr:VOC family protein [Bacteroidia bacterium]NNL33371.1 VOC family protein [Flavobacteriaceae bacterium]
MEHNMVGWFEVPSIDINRAKTFYDKVFDINIQIQDFGGVLMGWFPFAEGKSGASGSLVQHESYEPSDKKGVLVYFSSEDLSIELGRVEAAGGKVIQSKKQISPDVGFMGLFIDSEGNRMALHSRS